MMILRILTFLCLLFSCPATSQNKFDFVTIERTSCFGRCPAYILTIYRSGVIVYEGKKDARFKGTYQTKANTKKVISLFKKYENQKLSGLKSMYVDQVKDNSKLHVDIHYNQTNKYIKNAQAGPVFLQKLSNHLDSLAADSSLKWTAVEMNEISDLYPDAVSPKGHEESVYPAKEEVFQIVEQMPQFPGGEDALNQYLNSHIQYPKTAADKGISGTVMLSFIVNKEGNIEKVNMLKGIGSGCDEEAIRVVKMMPKWLPGRQNGQKVNVLFTLPIRFELNN